MRNPSQTDLRERLRVTTYTVTTVDPLARRHVSYSLGSIERVSWPSSWGKPTAPHGDNVTTVREEGTPADEDLPVRIDGLIYQLTRHAAPAVGEGAVKLRLWSSEFNRVGVAHLIKVIEASRGEISRDAAFRDPIVAPFLAHYGVPRPD